MKLQYNVSERGVALFLSLAIATGQWRGAVSKGAVGAAPEKQSQAPARDSLSDLIESSYLWQGAVSNAGLSAGLSIAAGSSSSLRYDHISANWPAWRAADEMHTRAVSRDKFSDLIESSYQWQGAVAQAANRAGFRTEVGSAALIQRNSARLRQPQNAEDVGLLLGVPKIVWVILADVLALALFVSCIPLAVCYATLPKRLEGDPSTMPSTEKLEDDTSMLLFQQFPP